MARQSWQYQAFLLRIWSVNGQPTWTWRASLENAHTGEVVYFATVDDLFDFIRDQTGAIPDLGGGAWKRNQQR